MSVDYAEGHGLPEVCGLPHLICEEQPQFEVWPPGELFQTTPLDLSVRRRHCKPEPEIAASSSASTSAFKKSILKRYSKYKGSLTHFIFTK